jgi:TetR/AcrR family transcriptional regulator|uniref:Putative Bacterial regulatory protein, TetR n=1 Tax=mine drainage metagenome TaxID=410659 RepID=E6QNE6_9ZZZZ
MAAKPGERKLQILQTVAHMLEQPKGEKITTAALAARLELSEAALYRHFASKAQMFEGLIEFIEQTVFGLINKITQDEKSGLKQVDAIVSMLLGFAQKNRGMTRVLIGDALVNEDERLQLRINQLLDRIEATLKQSLRMAVTQGEMGEAVGGKAQDVSVSGTGVPPVSPSRTVSGEDISAHANVLLCFVIGRWLQFGKSGFTREPLAQWPAQSAVLLNK